MPDQVRAFCHFGRYHDIEVEDDVTAYLEYSDGMTAVFSASTGEAPGTNRLEVAAERGRVVIENDLFFFNRNEVPMSDFSRTDPGRFSAPQLGKSESQSVATARSTMEFWGILSRLSWMARR